MDAEIRIVETMSPWTVGERFPNVDLNWGMLVMGPMVPVSRPKRSPPMEIRVAAGM